LWRRPTLIAKFKVNVRLSDTILDDGQVSAGTVVLVITVGLICGIRVGLGKSLCRPNMDCPTIVFESCFLISPSGVCCFHFEEKPCCGFGCALPLTTKVGFFSSN